jgi:hypothetical protein
VLRTVRTDAKREDFVRLKRLSILLDGISENDPITAPFYNFGKGSQALYRQPQGEKQRAVSVRCVRE